jgi:serine/threonine protein kinase
VLYLAHDIAAALVHLHAEGIAHGDIKAANVLLTSGGVVGEARRAAWAAPTAADAAAGGGSGGTTKYMADGTKGQAGVGVALTAKLADFGLAVLNLDTHNHITYGMRVRRGWVGAGCGAIVYRVCLRGRKGSLIRPHVL